MLPPSLLFCTPDKTRTTIDSESILGQFFPSLLGDQALEILSSPCTEEEISCRHAIFTRLQDESFRAQLQSFLEALTALFQAVQYCKDAKNECEILLSFHTYASCFVKAHRAASAIQGDDTIFNPFFQYFQEKKALCDELEPRLSELEMPLKDIYTSKLFFTPIGTFATADDPRGGMLDTLRNCSNNLGLCEFKLPAQRPLAMPSELSGALLQLYPEQFGKIRQINLAFAPRLTDEILQYRKELMFYFNLQSLIDLAISKGIPVCLPKVSKTPKFCAHNAYDVTLLSKEGVNIIPNDIEFEKEDSFCFLTGANGGGKTTYLRSVSANLLLAVCGCPIFAEEATVFPFSFVGIHFPVDETNESGRLTEEQKRVEELFASASEGGFLFFNETFSGADDKKGLVLTLDCAERCRNEKVFGLFVTHFHEINGHDFSVLNTVIDPENENRRTYKIAKNTGVRSSYAEDILKKYKLSKDTLKLRGEDK